MKEKVQDTVRGLQDLTEEEREDVLSYLTKCLTTDEELKDLDEDAQERTWAERGRRLGGGRWTHCRQSALVGLVLISLSWPKVFKVLTSGELQMEGPAGSPLSSLFNAACVLTEACVEAILEFLEALEGDEESGWMLMWRTC